MMDKKLLKKYASSSHQILFSEIKDVLSRLIASESKKQTNQKLENLCIEVRAQTLPEVADRIAYTWFNRLTILRMLEVRERLLKKGTKKIVSKNFWHDLNLVFQVYARQRESLTELFIHSEIADDFLFLINEQEREKIFRPFIENLLTLPTENFLQVEMLGWIYQYYNSLEKTYFIKLKKPYKKSTVPIVTQIFTPKFIVKFLVQNSLGRFLVEHQIIKPKSSWQFFLSQNLEVEKEKVNLKEVKFFDPCCGSGHMLTYAFEILASAYEENGFSKLHAAKEILAYNIYGLDVDEFAVQIARAALILKAGEYAEAPLKTLLQNLEINVHAVPESNVFGRSFIQTFPDGPIREEAIELFELFDNAKEIGALLIPQKKSYPELQNFLLEHEHQYEFLESALCVYNILSDRFEIVCTNPPYINAIFMDNYLKQFITKNYQNYRRDIFACFVKRAAEFTAPGGYFAMMTPQVWLTTVSFTKLREFILEETNLVSLLKLAPETFFGEAAVDIALFVAQKSARSESTTTFIQLEEKGGLEVAAEELTNELQKSNSEKIFRRSQKVFEELPNQILAFQAPAEMLNIIKNTPTLETFAKPRQGIITGDNEKFLRYWFEIPKDSVGWVPHNKGGEFRKWYGNQDYVINWQDGGKVLKEHKSGEQKLSRLQNLEFNFQPAVSWSAVTSGELSARFYDESFTFNVAGPSCFAPPSLRKYLLGFLNSSVANEFAKIISPTMNYNVGDIAKLPFILNREYQPEVDELVEENIALAKADWDMFETSWDFQMHPLLVVNDSKNRELNLKHAFKIWHDTCKARFNKLKQNEERLNQIFLKIYKLEHIISSAVPDDKISLRLINEKLAAKTFLSFFVGVMFGRLKVAGFNKQADILYTHDNSTIEQLKDFLTITCGEINLENNLEWLANALGKAAGENASEVISTYFKTEFFSDHLKTYKNTPIYWQINSGPQGALRGLVYVHKFPMSEIKTKLFLEISNRQNDLLERLNGLEQKKSATIWPTERMRLEDLQTKIIAELRELNEFHQKLTALNLAEVKLDFNLGIKKNYEKLASILTELKLSRYFRQKQQILSQNPN